MREASSEASILSTGPDWFPTGSGWSAGCDMRLPGWMISERLIDDIKTARPAEVTSNPWSEENL
jgi:hypothetical protein